MTDRQKVIYVYADWSGCEPVLFGRLYVNYIRGKEVSSFEYDEKWLRSGKHPFFDPNLNYYAGRQYAPADRELFGIFSDSCPDRWGRRLIQRREAIAAKKEERPQRKLYESDYLLGVYDLTRMGALRYKTDMNGQFLSSDKELAAPPWTSLRQLENAARQLEESGENEGEKWLRQLLAPGSSLGGARPKASVTDTKGELWIAKFPSKNDAYDVGAWEMVVHELAQSCGIAVPEAQLLDLSGGYHTLMSKRFDRVKDKRLHFSSAMALLGKKDGEDGSYIDILSFIKSYGARPRNDGEELFKRMVFAIAVSDTDNHLRNHGFILGEEGWRLAPMYDVNPSVYGGDMALSIDGYSGMLDYDLALSSAKYYNISSARAQTLISEIKGVVSADWQKVATWCGIGKGEIESMAGAFRI